MSSRACGRVKSVLVFGSGETARAVVATIAARRRLDSSRSRLRMKGPALFTAETRRHLASTVLPAVDGLMDRLGIPRQRYDLSIVNIAAASTNDTGLNVSGFSADAAVFLALASASLGIPVPADTAVTGHVASAEGDIRCVRSLPAKIKAARADRRIARFICPSLDADDSLQVLSPSEQEAARDVLTAAAGELRTESVEDIAGLAQAVWDGDDIVLSALRKSFFFECDDDDGSSASPMDRAASFFTQDNEGRFWSCLERHLLAGKARDAQALLRASLDFHIRRKEYPAEFGARLLALCRSLPRPVRRLKKLFPLAPLRTVTRLAALAGEPDREDLRALLDAILGRAGQPAQTRPADMPSAAGAVDAVLEEIDAETLNATIGAPIDAARAGYALEEATIDSHEEFYDTVCAFYTHLLRHTGVISAASDEHLAEDALALLQKAFADRGDVDAALAEARDGINGGMRNVLDAMTECFKAEQQTRRVSRVLKEAVDPLDWKERVSFTSGLLARLAPLLPPEMRSLPPERFARHYETIARAYVSTLDGLKKLLRRL